METALSSFRYRDFVFKIDILGSDIWRWTILPRLESDLTLIGQFVGPREKAISYCRAEIDRVLARAH